MTSFKHGDRVLITAAGHPWKGHAGTITRPFDAPSAPELKWAVAIDGAWSEGAVAESEIRPAEGGSPS